MIQKKVLLPLLAGAIILGGGAVAYAQENSGTTTPTLVEDVVKFRPMQDLVKKIAERFHLNEADVQKVFDEVHDEHKAEMEKKVEERLSEAVKNGKITEAQKNAILEKHKEIRAFHESLKDLSPEEMKTKMQEFHKNLNSWWESQGIPEDVRREIGFFGAVKFYKHGFKHGVMFERRLDN